MSARGSNSGVTGHGSAMGRFDASVVEKQDMRELLDRLKRLEAVVLPAEHVGARRAPSIPDPTVNTEPTEDFEDTYNELRLTAENTIPEVRMCDYAQFKNRFTPEEGRYAVDVLMSGDLLHQEISEEKKVREKLSKLGGGGLSTRAAKTKAAVAVKTGLNNIDAINAAQDDSTWPRRIRIQSPALLKIFASIQEESWSDRPRTYYRPFMSLIFYYDKVLEVHKDLERNWGAKLDRKLALGKNDSGDNEGATVDSSGESNSENEDESDSKESQEDPLQTLAVLRSYVEFMNAEIIPDYRRFEELDGMSSAESTKVRYSDLRFLFRTGELLFRPVEGDVSMKRDFRYGKRIWKSYYVSTASERLLAEASDEQDTAEEDGQYKHAFEIGGYYIEYSGEEFFTVQKPFKIQPYLGEMSITSLPIFPLRFAAKHTELKKKTLEKSQLLLKLIETKHCQYNGWTLTRSPTGEITTDATGNKIQHPEHINSEVMVDFTEAFQQCPFWRPKKAILEPQEVVQHTESGTFTIKWWSDIDRTKMIYEASELLPSKTGIGSKERNQYVTEDPFLSVIVKNEKRGLMTGKEHLNDEAKILLTGRVFAYVFQERKFAQLAINKLRPSVGSLEALNLLSIPRRYKDAIQGAVQGRLRRKAAERKVNRDWTSLDLIQGKGSGLFILLHGVPGVGKTATAEAVALANSKPLFKITVGDLGMTPDTVESKLCEIFRLASIWDCILLLDEVDTFFSQRSKADSAMTKNAVVSVFLRVLDYYNGILFLTTNRPGALDEAFNSRIHYKIYYPPLTREQTIEIWKLNISRVRRVENELAKVEKRPALQMDEDNILRFAQRHFDTGEPVVGDEPATSKTSYEGGRTKRSHSRWNGRQIRNAFQVARSLAYYEYHDREEQAAKERAELQKQKEERTLRLQESQQHAKSDQDHHDEQQSLEQQKQNQAEDDDSDDDDDDDDDHEEHTSGPQSAGGQQQMPTTAADMLPQLSPPKLEWRHFQTMHDISASFDRYILEVHGGQTAAELARQNEHRADYYQDKLTKAIDKEHKLEQLKQQEQSAIQQVMHRGRGDHLDPDPPYQQQQQGHQRGGVGGRGRENSAMWSPSIGRSAASPPMTFEFDRLDEFGTSPTSVRPSDMSGNSNQPFDGRVRPMQGNFQRTGSADGGTGVGTPLLPNLAVPDDDGGGKFGVVPQQQRPLQRPLQRENSRASQRGGNNNNAGGNNNADSRYSPGSLAPYHANSSGNLQTLQPQPQRQWDASGCTTSLTPRGNSPAIDDSGMPVGPNATVGGMGPGESNNMGRSAIGQDLGRRDERYLDAEGGGDDGGTEMPASVNINSNNSRNKSYRQAQGQNQAQGQQIMRQGQDPRQSYQSFNSPPQGQSFNSPPQGQNFNSPPQGQSFNSPPQGHRSYDQGGGRNQWGRLPRNDDAQSFGGDSGFVNYHQQQQQYDGRSSGPPVDVGSRPGQGYRNRVESFSSQARSSQGGRDGWASRDTDLSFPSEDDDDDGRHAGVGPGSRHG